MHRQSVQDTSVLSVIRTMKTSRISEPAILSGFSHTVIKTSETEQSRAVMSSNVINVPTKDQFENSLFRLEDTFV